MSILAVKITSARNHENAEKLRVYSVEAPGIEPTVIVANTDVTYEVGDTVRAALVGTLLADNIEIKKMRVRGVLSFGMLMGKTEHPVGTDLTVQAGATHVERVVDESQGVVEESVWPRYTNVDGFLRVRHEILAVPDVVVSEKLHGSNTRFGFHGSRPYMVGTAESRVVDSRLDPATWPKGHLVRKTLEWGESVGMGDRVAKWRTANPTVTSLAVFGEVCGFKCSDLHYGRTDQSEVLLFGEVAVDGRFLGYDDSIDVLTHLFPEGVDKHMVPILYRGKPDVDVFKRLRDQTSVLAGRRGTVQISEGIVIRPTTEGVSKVTMNRLLAKYKGPLYEERRSLRDADPNQLPIYVSAYDLLQDFVTDERIRHVLSKVEASGGVIEKKQMSDFANRLYDDIRKESIREWPPGSELLSEDTLRKWTFRIAGESMASLIEAWGKP